MKNKRRSCIVLAMTTLCVLAADPVYASVEIWGFMGELPQSTGNISYVIDFFDWDGRILDSKICTYGEKMEDIMIPEDWEDGECMYRFMGWEPQLSEIVTGTAAYTAVYQATGGSDEGSGNVISGAEIWGASESAVRTTSNNACPDEIQQVSATSYDVTSFRIETSTEKTDIDELKEQADVQAEEIPSVFTPGSDVTPDMPKEERVAAARPVENPQVMSEGTEDMPGSLEVDDPIEISAAADRGQAEDVSVIVPEYESPKSQQAAEAEEIKKEEVKEGAIEEEEIKTEEMKAEKMEVGKTKIPSMQIAQKPSADRKTGKRSFPLQKLLLGAAVGGGAMWFKKRKICLWDI